MKITPATVLFIIGPTAIGKSELAFNLAQELGGEIVSADSMQIYRGMDIGTGKPSKMERKKVRHHLIDIRSPSQSFSVFDFHQHAIDAILEIKSRKKIPMVVGGTGFYIRTLLDGLDPSPPPNPELRKKLERDFKQKGLGFLVKKLSKFDPKKIKEVDIKNPRRVIRALEIYLLKKKNLGLKQPRLKAISEMGLSPMIIGLRCERQQLYQRIDDRVEKMFSRGWVQEVKRLSKQRLSKTAKQAIGYSRILPVLRNKTIRKADLEPLISQVKIDTRRYAKRQLTWFRKEKASFWLESTSPALEGGAYQTALTLLR